MHVIGAIAADVNRASEELKAFGFICGGEESQLTLLVGEAPQGRETPRDVVRVSGLEETDLEQAVRQMFVRAASDRLATVRRDAERERTVLGGLSFRDLLSGDLLVPAPYRVESGAPARELPLLPPRGAADAPAYLTQMVRDQKFILVLGPPGLGKSTASLHALDALETTPQVIFAKGRNFVQTGITDAHTFLRWAVAQEGQLPWPARAPLEETGWTVIIDGLDEWQASRELRIKIVGTLRSVAVAALFSCREHDYRHDLRQLHETVEVIVHLEEWSAREQQLYIQLLRGAGRIKAAEALETWKPLQRGEPWRELSIPLWLSLLANLAQEGLNSRATRAYELLEEVSHALAEGELRRAQISGDHAEQLERQWATAAWFIHRARRNRSSSSLNELSAATSLDVDSPRWRVFVSVLEVTRTQRVLGFYHELFFEFYLARYIYDAMVRQANDRVVEALSYQRSIVTNRFVRDALSSRGTGRYEILDSLADLLRRQMTLPRSDFAKSQIVYFLARVDDRRGTRLLLAALWRSDESLFVRQSAAWGAIMLGDEEVESEYYDGITRDGSEASANRGYHLSYYGDLPEIDEEDVPVLDLGNVPASNTLRILIDRLGRGRPRHSYLRRVELATIRQFLESGRPLPVDVVGAQKALRAAGEAPTRGEWSDRYRSGIAIEIQNLTRLFRRQRPRKAVALVLRGGGVKGLAFGSALEVLDQYYDFEPILGTSAGAITAVLLGAGYSGEELREEIEKTDFGDLLDSSGPMKYVNLVFKKGMHSGNKLQGWIASLLARKLDREIVQLKHLPKRVVIFANKVGAGTMRFDSIDERRDTRADFAVRCSMALPFVFQPASDEGVAVIDGGMLNNLPIDQLEGVSAGQFVALYLGSVKIPRRGPFWPLDPIRVWYSGTEPSLVNQHREDIVVIDTDPIGTADFALTEWEKRLLIARGRLAALEFVQRKGIDPSVGDEIVTATRDAAEAYMQVQKCRQPWFSKLADMVLGP